MRNFLPEDVCAAYYQNQLYLSSVHKHMMNLLCFLRSSWCIHAYIHIWLSVLCRVCLVFPPRVCLFGSFLVQLCLSDYPCVCIVLSVQLVFVWSTRDSRCSCISVLPCLALLVRIKDCIFEFILVSCSSVLPVVCTVTLTWEQKHVNQIRNISMILNCLPRQMLGIDTFPAQYFQMLVTVTHWLYFWMHMRYDRSHRPHADIRWYHVCCQYLRSRNAVGNVMKALEEGSIKDLHLGRRKLFQSQMQEEYWLQFSFCCNESGLITELNASKGKWAQASGHLYYYSL